MSEVVLFSDISHLLPLTCDSDPAVYPHFELYPKALQITETLKQKEVDVRLVNVGYLTAEYPNMIICK